MSDMIDEERAERIADMEATYLLLCEFCVQMEFRGSSLNGAMAIMLFQMAAARGLSREEALDDLSRMWNSVKLAETLCDRAARTTH